MLYRNFESWNIRQRRKLLTVHYEAQQTKIFEVVKKEPRGGLHYLETANKATVLASSDDGTQLHLDAEHSFALPAEIRVAHGSINIVDKDDQVVTIDGDWMLEDGTEVEVVQHDVTPAQILNRLESFWSARWNVRALPTAEDWNRILNFAQAFMPRGHLDHSVIGVEEWMEINTRYGPRSARGPDGFDPRDLQRMPYEFQQEIVTILNECERQCYWPKALRTGYVHSLAKVDEAYKVNQCRPVIIYPTIYRSWGSLRSKSLLRHLATFVDETQIGFIPGREVAELWMLLQAIIELGMIEGTHYAGFVTDLKKAFESLPRDPIWSLAKQLGLPTMVIDLWAFFLSVTERRFVVRGEVGEGILSNHGFPEGCSLSCTAMTIAGISLHCYMQEFGRLCRTLSYVDNLELLAKRVWDVHTNILALQTWCDMWRLELDLEKSYIWATDPVARADAVKLGWTVSKSSKDLGAQMNYGRSGDVNAMTQRIASLAPLWPKLYRCLAPIWQKLKLLRQSLWPKAFYRASICTLGWTHIKHLRTEAMRALRFRKAGASPALLLGIVCHEQCDPGFYQVWQVLLNFRRIARKRPQIIQLWYEYMMKYQGASRQGPFAKLLEVCAALKWSIEVPYIADRDGVWHDWLHLDERVIYELACEGWSWKIWEEVRTRKDMQGLYGIDRLAVKAAQGKVAAHNLPAIMRLRDGSFMEPKQHAKYDFAKITRCGQCGEEDSITHRCTQCSGRRHLHAKFSRVIQKWEEWGPAKALHLLPSENPFWGHFKTKMCAFTDTMEKRALHSDDGSLHLFTDASCVGGRNPSYARSAWAVVSPEEDAWVARGALGGIGHCADRAELRAGIAAIDYAMQQERDATIWTDCTFVAEGMYRLLCNIHDLPQGAHQDDWLEMQGLLCHRENVITVQHVPGHARVSLNDQDFDDWAARWNARVDREARIALTLHGEELFRLHLELLAHHEREVRDLCELQDLHLALAVPTEKTVPAEDEEENDGDEDPVDHLVERGCLDGRMQLQGLPIHFGDDLLPLTERFGSTYVHKMLETLRSWEDSSRVKVYKISFLELAIFGLTEGRAWIPMPHTSKPNCWQDRGVLNYSEPTVAAGERHSAELHQAALGCLEESLREALSQHCSED
eukprot:s1838_g12.t1